MIDPARSFDRAAEVYEAARPSYPDALLDVLPLPATATVLDVGAGTGKLTRVLDTVDSSPLPDAYTARLEELVSAAPYTGMDDSRRSEVVRAAPFGESQRASVSHEQLQDRAGVLAFISSVSAVARLPEPERTALLDELGALLDADVYRFAIRANVRWAVRD